MLNTPILLIFFNRPDTFQQVFDVIKKVQPAKLYLAQDGPRNEGDAENIAKCRAIASDIDWECEVNTNYSDVNLGCGMRPQTAISWALEKEESVIILEDDCVADLSFFPYCEELLEKYKNDERIAYISGLNHFEEWDFGASSYGYTKGGAIWGWATWKRAWAKYDYSAGAINDPYLKKLLYSHEMLAKDKIPVWERTYAAVQNNTKLSYWDIQWGLIKYAHNQLVITPKYNLIKNIGVGESSTHGKHHNTKHKKYLDYNNMDTRSLTFPLVHPAHMMRDFEYDAFLCECNQKQIRLNLVNAMKRKLKKVVFAGKNG